jgi:hypothetical protein
MQPVIVLVTRVLFFHDLLGGFLHCRIREPLNHPAPRRFKPLERVHTCRVPLNPSSEPRMSLVETLELLSKAREYVAQGQEELIEQREIVDQLERCGHDPLEAILFLEDLEDMQDVYVAHMDRLERQVMRLVRPD